MPSQVPRLLFMSDQSCSLNKDSSKSKFLTRRHLPLPRRFWDHRHCWCNWRDRGLVSFKPFDQRVCQCIYCYSDCGSGSPGAVVVEASVDLAAITLWLPVLALLFAPTCMGVLSGHLPRSGGSFPRACGRIGRDELAQSTSRQRWCTLCSGSSVSPLRNPTQSLTWRDDKVT